MFVSIASVVICLEILLRLTPYRSFIAATSQLRYYYRADPETGFDIRENYQKTAAYIPWENFKYEIWSNELGCFDLPYKGEKDFVLLVGDSFTQASCSFEDTYGVILEQLLGYRVLKCGVGAYSTKYEFIKANRIIRKIKASPRLIIIGYHTNDLRGDHSFPGATVVEGYLIETKSVNPKTGEILYLKDDPKKMLARWKRSGDPFLQSPALIRKIKWRLTQHSILYMMTKESLKKFIFRITWIKDLISKFEIAREKESLEQLDYSFCHVDDYPWLDEVWKGHLQNLRAFKDLASQNGARLLVVIIPWSEQVYPFLLKGKNIDLEQPNKILHNFFEEEGIPYLDLLPIFRKYADGSPRKYINSKKDLYWKNDGHWNMKGNRLAGLLVARYILENSLIDINDKDEKLNAIERKLKDFR